MNPRASHTGLKPGVNESRKTPHFSCRTKSFFHAAKNIDFLKREKPAFPLAETRFFSQRFIKQKNRVKPTVGFIFRKVAW
jgi:hypothetical protein